MTPHDTSVLIADDDPRLLRALAMRLRSDGFTVLTHSDGYCAIEGLRRYRPDVMLVDVLLPAGSGFSVLESARGGVDGRFSPVILMTGSSDPYVDVEARRLGAVGVLRKPFDEQRLLHMIERAVDFHPACPQPAR